MSASYLFSQNAKTIAPQFLPIGPTGAPAHPYVENPMNEDLASAGYNILGVNRLAFGPVGTQYISSIQNQLILNDSGAPGDCVVAVSNGGGGGGQPPFSRIFDTFYNSPYEVPVKSITVGGDLTYAEYGAVTRVISTGLGTANIQMNEEFDKEYLLFGIIPDPSCDADFNVNYGTSSGGASILINCTSISNDKGKLIWFIRTSADTVIRLG